MKHSRHSHLFLAVVLATTTYGQIHLLTSKQVARSGVTGVEAGDGMYFKAGTQHGHAALWCGVSADLANPYNKTLAKADDGGLQDPRVSFAASIIHQTGSESSSSGGEGIKIEGKAGTVRWADAFAVDPNGSLLDLMQKAYSTVCQKAYSTVFESQKLYCHSIGGPLTSVKHRERDRNIGVADDLEYLKAQIGYTWADMLNPKGSTWDNALTDIDELRCEGLVEVAMEHSELYYSDATRLAVSCGDNIMTESGSASLAAHNNLHLGSWGSGEVCPLIQGNATNAPDHDDVNFSSMTQMTRNISGVPYLFGASVRRTGTNSLELSLDVDDYGYGWVYVTVAGYFPGWPLELLVLGENPTRPFTDDNVLYFWNQCLSMTYTPYALPALGPYNLPHHYDYLNINWSGNTIGKDHVEWEDEPVDAYPCFYVGLMDKSGNYSVWHVVNPLYYQ